jgi:hypothetical protein
MNVRIQPKDGDYSLQQLSNQLARIEREISAMRRKLVQRELARVEQPTVNRARPLAAGQGVPWADKQALRAEFMRSLAAQAIEGELLGATVLQQRLVHEGLATNELSQALIAARDE